MAKDREPELRSFAAVAGPQPEEVALALDGDPDDHIDRPADDLPVADLDHDRVDEDHRTGCYRTTELLSGPSTFVLSNAGHIASLVNPPGDPKASYWVGGQPGPDPAAWRETAEKRTGTWWEAWADWLLERSGDERPAPSATGNSDHAPLQPAPGSYVVDGGPPLRRE